MLWVKVESGAIASPPLTLTDIIRLNPQVSFPQSGPRAEWLEEQGYVPIQQEEIVPDPTEEHGPWSEVTIVNGTPKRSRGVVPKSPQQLMQEASDALVAAGFQYNGHTYPLDREIGGLNMLLAEAGLMRYGQNSVRFPDINGEYVLFTKSEFQAFAPLYAAAFNAARGGA